MDNNQDVMIHFGYGKKIFRCGRWSSMESERPTYYYLSDEWNFKEMIYSHLVDWIHINED